MVFSTQLPYPNGLMDTQTQAQIYLADQRGRSESATSLSFHTFNFGQYVAEGREPFGPLYLLNDDTLGAGASLTMQTEQPTVVILLPISGGLDYTCADTSRSLEPGQAGILSLPAGITYSLLNPYLTELINCLQLWLTKPYTSFTPNVDQTEFDLATPNCLVPFMGDFPPTETDQPFDSRGYIGRYVGRQEGTYTIRPVDRQTRRVFVFVIQGVFEVANRLLHEKDGLALAYDAEHDLEFEALSNDALLLLIDLSTGN